VRNSYFIWNVFSVFSTAGEFINNKRTILSLAFAEDLFFLNKNYFEYFEKF